MKLPALAPALFLLISASSSASTTALSNTGNSSSGAATLAASSTMIMMPGPGGFPMPMMFSNGSAVANSFTTSGDPMPLEAVTLLLGTSTGADMDFTVSIINDNAGTPGGSIFAILTGNTMPSAAGEYSYTTGPGGLVLAANTTYWLRVELANPALNTSSSVPWNETSDLSESSPDGWAMGTKLTQTITNGSAGAWSSDPTRAMMFSLDVVPEPASAASALLAGGLLLRRRRPMAV